MSLGDYGLAIGAGTEGYRQQEQDAMKKESSDLTNEKTRMQFEVAKKTLAKEGFRESVQMIISGDLRGAEDSFNEVGDDRVTPGSTKFDHKTGLVTWKDADGEDQVADIRMMAAMANIRLPKRKEGQSSADYYRRLNYGLKLSKHKRGDQRLQLSRRKLVKKSVVELFGGFYDPVTEKIKGLSKTAHKQMAAISKRGIDIMRENPGISEQDAANRAASEAGIDIPGTSGGGGTTKLFKPTSGPKYKKSVGILKKDSTPQMRKYFDETYGKGAAAKALGK